MTVDVALPLVGAALLLLVGFDVVITVFHPQGRGGPINRTQNHWTWVAFRAVALRVPEQRRANVLALCGPFLAVLTITSWALLLILGFALIYYPFIDRFPVSPGRAEVPWVTAVYYSGYIASTVGLGDIVPPSPALRLVTVAEGLAGFSVFAIAVSYVLAVYREIGVAATLALNIEGYFRRGAWHIVETAQRMGYSSLNSWVDQVTGNLLRVAQSRSQYPIIQYFHSSDSDQALPTQLGHLIALLEVSSRDPGEGSRVQAASPSLDALHMAMAKYLKEINEYVIPEGFEPIGEEDPKRFLDRNYRRYLRYMLYPAADDPSGAVPQPDERD